MVCFHSLPPIHDVALIHSFIIGCLIAWMVSSNATEATIDYFIATLWKHNPSIILTRWMLDFHKEQLKVLDRYYPNLVIYLCWWHILHTWQQHLVISHYKDLWTLLKGWVRIVEQSEFDACWAKVQQLAPKSFIDYITTTWMPVVKLWSAIWWTDHTIFEFSEMNMLVESYVHRIVTEAFS